MMDMVVEFMGKAMLIVFFGAIIVGLIVLVIALINEFFF